MLRVAIFYLFVGFTSGSLATAILMQPSEPRAVKVRECAICFSGVLLFLLICAVLPTASGR